MNSTIAQQYQQNFTLFLQLVASNFSRFRDYHRHNDSLSLHLVQFPILVIVNILAEWANATFHDMVVNFANFEEKGYCHPKIQMYSTTWGNQSLGIWKVPCSHPVETMHRTSPQLIEVASAPWSFTYCSVEKKETYSVWKFNIFADPFDIWTWTLLIVSLVLVATLSTFTISGENGQGIFHQVIMSTLSVTLTLGTYALHRRSKLFLLWMGLCLIIPTFYIGVIQSTLISPPEDDVIKAFAELKENNYSLVLGESMYLLKDDVASYLDSIQFSSSGEILKWLFNKVRFTSDHTLVNVLGFEEGNWVTAGPWYTSHLYNWLHSQRVSVSLNPAETKKAKRCHVGEELITMGLDFLSFNPPGHDKLAWACAGLLHSGIYKRWDDEGYALMHSERIQDRTRVKSPKIILKLETSVIHALGMKGKLVTVFLLWIVCIILCVIGLCFELCVHNCLAGSTKVNRGTNKCFNPFAA